MSGNFGKGKINGHVLPGERRKQKEQSRCTLAPYGGSAGTLAAAVGGQGTSRPWGGAFEVLALFPAFQSSQEAESGLESLGRQWSPQAELQSWLSS